jgi:hypothetical protein
MFGGIKSKGTMLKSIEKYSFKRKIWEKAGQLLKPRSNPVIHVLDEQSKKIMIVGGID